MSFLKLRTSQVKVEKGRNWKWALMFSVWQGDKQDKQWPKKLTMQEIGAKCILDDKVYFGFRQKHFQVLIIFASNQTYGQAKYQPWLWSCVSMQAHSWAKNSICEAADLSFSCKWEHSEQAKHHYPIPPFLQISWTIAVA